MWTRKKSENSDQEKRFLEEKTSKQGYKTPEQRVEDAELLKQTYVKTITSLFDHLTVIKLQYACNRFMTSLNIEHAIDKVLASIKEEEGDFAIQSKQFLKHLDYAFYEEKEAEEILDKLASVISLAIELKQARLKIELFKPLIYDRIANIVMVVHDLIAETAFPVSRYKPPQLV